MCFLPPLKSFTLAYFIFVTLYLEFFYKTNGYFTAIRNPKKAECINFTGYEI